MIKSEDSLNKNKSLFDSIILQVEKTNGYFTCKIGKIQLVDLRNTTNKQSHVPVTQLCHFHTKGMTPNRHKFKGTIHYGWPKSGSIWSSIFYMLTVD